MKRLTGVVAIGMLALVAFAAQDKTAAHQVAQGEYSAVVKNPQQPEKIVKVDQWRMLAMPDGSYSVVVEMQSGPEQPKMQESLGFTSNMKPAAFGLVLTAPDDSSQSVKIFCGFVLEEISCHSEAPGMSVSAKLAQAMPSVFMPSSELPALDMPWFFQSLAAQAERTAGRTTSMPLITIEDGETENSIVLKVQETEQVQYLGREKLNVVNQDVLAHKFHYQDPKGGSSMDIWLSASGLLLQTTGGEGPKYVLTSYQGPPL